MTETPDDIRRTYEEAFRQVMAHQSMLQVFARALVHDPHLAEDVLSDASVEIARTWARYDPTQPFGPWARGVVRNVALASLRKRRSQPVLLAPETLEAVSAEIDDLDARSLLEQRKARLSRCLQSLSAKSRSLVRLRYFENQALPEIAERVSLGINSLYVAFNRIHKALHECVEKPAEATS